MGSGRLPIYLTSLSQGKGQAKFSRYPVQLPTLEVEVELV